ncbi:hypothetical protein [Stenotrophomonas geniculata]|uniref:hypothetical protein n=1 Tax=Stenotrophomonas geniculata TaxID=86188 RepID=UPI002E75C418|nr:hypothetical protein [Stenotrophomonas geniculata]
MEVDVARALRDAVADFCAEQGEAVAAALVDPGMAGDAIVAKIAQKLDTAKAAAAINAKLDSDGAVLLEDVFSPENGLAETPKQFSPVPLSPSMVSLQLSVFGANALLDKLTVSYGSENDGELFVNLVGMDSDDRRSEKSQKSMRGHTDAMSFPFPGDVDPLFPAIAPSPDLVCLGALRNPDKVPTTVMPLAEILRNLDEDVVAELMQPKFVLTCQDTFELGTIDKLGKRHTLLDAAILRGTEGAERWVRFSHGKITAAEEDVSGLDALLTFKDVVARHVRPVPLSPGDVLLVSNRRALHGRSTVGAETGGVSRWLVRSYGLDRRSAEKYLTPGSRFCLFP